ncbi:Rha family transcriptional regulator [Bacillus cereus]|nr:Rha family transcriptional regulator [Bacillus cereus]
MKIPWECEDCKHEEVSSPFETYLSCPECGSACFFHGEMINEDKEEKEMKELVFVNNNNEVVTDSLMVAEVFGKEHRNVMQAIRNLQDELLSIGDQKGVLSFQHTVYKHPQNNQSYPKCDMTKDGFTLLAMSFTGIKALEFKTKYIKEFNKMEEHIRKNGGLKVPTNFLEAIKECVRLEETRLQLETKIEEDKPKVEYHDRVLESESTYTATQIAAEFGMSAIKMNRVLKAMGIQRKVGGQWVLRTAFMNQGYTDTKTYEYEDNKTNQQLRWTEKGRNFIHKLIDSIEQQSLDLA